jgi:hypothetical protein
VDEKTLRDLFCYCIAALSFLYASPSAALFPSTAGEFRLCLGEEDPERTGSLSHPGRRAPLAGQTDPPLLFFPATRQSQPNGPAQRGLCVRPGLKKRGYSIFDF